MASKKLPAETKQLIDKNLKIVYEALEKKGYNPEAQILGYILTEDPTYITTYNNARELITQLDRDEIGCHILEEYFGR